MFTKDYLMRQIQQMVQVMAKVLFLKRNGQTEEALQAIDQSLRDMPGLDAVSRTDLDRDEVLEACRSGSEFNAEMAVTLADLLREKADLLEGQGDQSRVYARYAVWLYEAALDGGGSAVPWNVHQHIARLREHIDVEGT